MNDVRYTGRLSLIMHHRHGLLKKLQLFILRSPAFCHPELVEGLQFSLRCRTFAPHYQKLKI